MNQTYSLSLVSLLVLLAIIAPLNPVFADSDEPPLFLAAGGQDSGNCQATKNPCRTLSYALQRVGKNGLIRVREGSYDLSDISDAIYVLSGAIDVRADETAASKPTLVGAAAEFASELEAKGFNVIVDTKGLNSSKAQAQLALQSNSAATPCVGGFAGAFPCDSVDLLSHVADRTPAARGADIWGFVDLNTYREYAIVGYTIGTAVFDVTDAENPAEVGFISGQTTTWRDIKVHQFWNATNNRFDAYAYITADNASDGLFIIDLTELPHSISRVSYNSDFAAAHNVYLVDVDFSTGLSITGQAPNLILAGSDLSDGRYRSYALTNPSAPGFINTPATPSDQPGNNRLYMHDAASMVVTDARKDTQCVNAGSSDHCDVLFDFNESSVDIWDITVPSTPARLSQVPYGSAGYTHSGWPTEDQQYLFIQDELDERDRGLNTTLRILSLADLTAPTVQTSWTGPTNAIDHNGFVRGNRYYMSNYSRGLTIFDISDPGNADIAGRFDTFPASDGVGFPGNWGTYPFLPSGNVALSDIDSGFYMVADNTLDVPQGSLSFSSATFAADETQPLTLTIDRNGGAQGATSVRWEIIAADGDAADLDTLSGSVDWADGDSSSRSINIGLNNDGTAEGLERVIVKLIAPTGGATISAPNIATGYISDPGDTSVVEFLSTSISVPERGFGKVIATVRRTGSASGALSVNYSVSAGDATAGGDFAGPVVMPITWADGDADPKSIEYTINDDGIAEPDEFFELQLNNPVGGTVGANSMLRVNILDGTGSNGAPNSVAGSSQTVASGASVTLNGNGSNDPDGDTLTYAWSQIQGPGVTLSNENTVQASFVAPSVSSDTLLRFQLNVSDGRVSDTSTVNVTVMSAGGGTASGGGGGGGPIALWSLLILAGLTQFRRKDAS